MFNKMIGKLLVKIFDVRKVLNQDILGKRTIKSLLSGEKGSFGANISCGHAYFDAIFTKAKEDENSLKVEYQMISLKDDKILTSNSKIIKIIPNKDITLSMFWWKRFNVFIPDFTF